MFHKLQFTGTKVEIDNIIQTMLPIFDAEGYAICPDCDSHVNYGTIRLTNLEKHHQDKKTCKAAQEKKKEIRQ